MGISIAPDIFQDHIFQIFEDLDTVKAYMDDLLVVTRGSYIEHLNELEIVMKRLTQVGIKCKIDKYLFCHPEIEYLGYIITREGVNPQPKKVQVIHDMQCPTTKTEVSHFLGMVQYWGFTEFRSKPTDVKALVYDYLLEPDCAILKHLRDTEWALLVSFKLAIFPIFQNVIIFINLVIMRISFRIVSDFILSDTFCL